MTKSMSLKCPWNFDSTVDSFALNSVFWSQTCSVWLCNKDTKVTPQNKSSMIIKVYHCSGKIMVSVHSAGSTERQGEEVVDSIGQTGTFSRDTNC